jgi:hypothetical protein
MNLRKFIVVLVLCAIAVSSPSLAQKTNETAKDIIAKTLASAPDIVKVGADVTVISGTNVNSAVAIGGNADIAGNIAKDVVAVGGSITLRSTARVNGNTVAIGGIIKKEPGARIAGEIKEVSMPHNLTALTVFGSKLAPSFLLVATVFAGLLTFLGILAIAITASILFPKKVGWTSAAIEHFPVKSFLWGVLWFILALPIALLLVISIIGIPLVVAQFVIYGVAEVLGYVAVSQILGKKLLMSFRKYNQPMVSEVVWGVVLVTLLSMVPFVGALVAIIVFPMGLGAVWMSRFGNGI